MVFAFVATVAPRARAESPVVPPPPPESPSPIRGSSLLFDQSATTQTARLETSPQQSYVPTYEWWLSLRPRYWLGEHVYVWLRADYYKELTNSGATTQYRDDVFGDVWTNAVYETTLGARSRTKVNLGIRALLPTSKESRANGVYVTAGLTSGISQRIPLREGSDWLDHARFGVSAAYTHPFSRATTATSLGGFGYVRQDTDGRSFVSDQLRGTTLVNHQLMIVVDSGLQITPKLGFTFDVIAINQWHYAPTGDVAVAVAGASAAVPRSSDDKQFTQSTWLLASFDYALLPELSLGVGYYNLANVIAPNGTRRGLFGGDNVWWSPDARVFFDATLNLDRIYDDLVRRSGGHRP